MLSNRLTVDPSLARAASETIMPPSPRDEGEFIKQTNEAIDLIHKVIGDSVGTNPSPFVPLPLGSEGDSVAGLYGIIVNGTLSRASEIVKELTRPCMEGAGEECIRGVERASIFVKYLPIIPQEIGRLLMHVVAVGALYPSNRLGEAITYGSIPVLPPERQEKKEQEKREVTHE
ncbi:MAG: hypothetical protein ACP5NY_04090 [Thermocladium sp.]